MKEAGEGAWDVGVGGVKVARTANLLRQGLAATEGAAALDGTPMSLMSGIGGVLGGLNFGKGAYDLTRAHGHLASSRGSQGALDLTGGGLAVGALAAPALMIPAAVAGIGAFGNSFAEEHGWYGSHMQPDGTRAANTFFGGIGEGASEGWIAGHELGGDGVVGAGLGTLLGGADAIGHTVLNSGAAVGGAAGKVGRGASYLWDAVTNW